jgi:hypothetical protein
MKVTKSSQLRIVTADKPGEFARILDVVAGGRVNVVAYAGYSRDQRGHIMLVTQDNAKALSLLKSAGFDVQEEPVVIVVDKDVLGSGAALVARIARAGVNLSGAYATGAGKGEYVTVFQTPNVEHLLAALR